MKNRRTVRDFSNEAIPLEAIKNAVRIAVSAPSGANKEPWTFAIVTDKKTKKKIRIAAEKEEKELPMDEAEDEGTAVSYSDTYATMEEEDRPDFPDIDKDGDTEESMKKAASDKKKRVKKESIETKLAEIGKAGEITKRLMSYRKAKKSKINKKKPNE